MKIPKPVRRRLKLEALETYKRPPMSAWGCAARIRDWLFHDWRSRQRWTKGSTLVDRFCRDMARALQDDIDRQILAELRSRTKYGAVFHERVTDPETEDVLAEYVVEPVEDEPAVYGEGLFRRIQKVVTGESASAAVTYGEPPVDFIPGENHVFGCSKLPEVDDGRMGEWEKATKARVRSPLSEYMDVRRFMYGDGKETD